MKKYIEVETEITDLTHDGRGVARVEGKALFVDAALPGETARVVVTRRHRHFDEGRVLELFTRSPDRVGPRCAHYERCGGCSLQHLALHKQILAKQHVLAGHIQRIGKDERGAGWPRRTGAGRWCRSHELC